VTQMEKKVLVVDSDYFFVEFLSELLTNRGYEVLKTIRLISFLPI